MPRRLSDKQKLQNYLRAAAEDAEPAVPQCRHFGECGGCDFQDIVYGAQPGLKRRGLAFVADTVISDFSEEGGKTGCELSDALAGVEPEVVPSPSPYGYRQRMDYVYAFGTAGLRRARRHRQVVELRECPLLGDAGFDVFQAALELAERHGIPSYDYMRHEGELRYFVIRRSRTDGIMLSLTTKTLECETVVRSILEELAGRGLIASGHWLHAPGLGDVSFGGSALHVGAPLIYEVMNGVRLGIGPNSFFQANPVVAEMAYARIGEFFHAGDTVLDMYSGVGSIALSVAARAGKVLAVENHPENVEVARENIRGSGAANVELIEADATDFLRSLTEGIDGKPPETVVVNPPRQGIGKKGMDAIVRLGPDRLCYLSCNPFTLLRDMSRALGRYSLRSLTLYDMFPQTRHFETLALFERRESGDGFPDSL